MQAVIEEIKILFHSFCKNKVAAITKLSPSGSDRVYYRIESSQQNYIATHNLNTKENETFFCFSNHFRKINVPVPEVFAVNEAGTIYIQQDFGDTNLLQVLEQNGLTDYAFGFYEKSLSALANLQINGDKNLDYSQCFASKGFGKNAIMNDLLYFKYYFLDTLKIVYDKEQLMQEFEALSTHLSVAENQYFMFRDFQSRNIMVQNEDIYFIDFQGGMKGALQYDVASLLWQAKAALNDEWKNKLFDYYMDCVEQVLQQKINREQFSNQYNGYVLIRLLQVLGAYGFRGLFERKTHFLSSIPLGLKNLKHFFENYNTEIEMPVLKKLIPLITNEETVKRFEKIKAGPETLLIISINSFSYKEGIPADTSGNGGGFVFDCRGIYNPGRKEEYKYLTGLDKPVIDFLEQQTEMPAFLNNIYSLIEITVTDYFKRGFEHLMISFGCTGGQHRSVYAAESLAKYLRQTFDVKVQLEHTNKNNWLKK